jgi:hypothetical protein
LPRACAQAQTPRPQPRPWPRLASLPVTQRALLAWPCPAQPSARSPAKPPPCPWPHTSGPSPPSKLPHDACPRRPHKLETAPSFSLHSSLTLTSLELPIVSSFAGSMLLPRCRCRRHAEVRRRGEPPSFLSLPSSPQLSLFFLVGVVLVVVVSAARLCSAVAPAQPAVGVARPMARPVLDVRPAGPSARSRAACAQRALAQSVRHAWLSFPIASVRPCACDACHVRAPLPMSSSFVARGQLAAPPPLPMHAAASPPSRNLRKTPNPVPNRIVVIPRLSSCSYCGRTHIRVCIACRRGLDDVRLPVDDARLPPSTLYTPLHMRAFAPFARVVVAFRVRGLCASSPSIRAMSRT